MKTLGTETAFLVLAKAKALEAKGKKVVHLEIGEPDFDTPANIKEAAKKGLDDGFTHYGPAPGLPQMRKTIADYSSKLLGNQFTPEQIVVTPGAKPIMFFAIMACVNPGDEVIYPNPGFPIYESVINFVGAKPVPLVLREEKGFRFDVADLAKLITPKTKMLIINTPQNPTGGILTKDDLRQIAELAVKHDLMVFSDEIYNRILYDGFEHTSISTFPGMAERTIILDGFSKTYAMTGWRLGWGIMPEPLVPFVSQLQINCTSCTSSFTQMAGIEALTGPQDEVDAMVAEFKKRRDVIVDGLNSIPGFRCHKPLGAFYVFPNISGTGKKSQAFADYLLNEAGVACLSGTAFGASGEGYLRFSYANSVENINIALDSIRKAVSR
ncbi:MAG: pyridoxal phosphate-dependent aminotransferase [Ignavibacteria bacterium]|nr:pyridoxal phosphate-dependent aminotransferase [Ignavibacteria bacterium]